MKITANQTFLDDRDRYEEGEEYEVPIEKGYYFCRLGWAHSAEMAEVEPSLEPVDIEVDNMKVETRGENII